MKLQKIKHMQKIAAGLGALVVSLGILTGTIILKMML